MKANNLETEANTNSEQLVIRLKQFADIVATHTCKLQQDPTYARTYIERIDSLVDEYAERIGWFRA